MTLSRRPNILLIMSDNQSAGTLGCYGNQEIRTPHLDRLATGGVRFNQAFCVNAMCSPCRASVLTGLMPSQHGIHNWLMNQRMAQWPAGSSAISEFPNLPTLLQEAGYNTALIGKWHLGPVGDNVPGFNHAVAMPPWTYGRFLRQPSYAWLRNASGARAFRRPFYARNHGIPRKPSER